MDRKVRARLKWVTIYEETGDAGLTCRCCGISRPTLRKWWRRCKAEGLDGLQSRSRRPKSSPQQRVFAEQEAWIRDLSQNRRFGVRRSQSELRWTHNFDLSLATIHKVLKRINAKPLKRKRWRKKTKRYQKDLPGEQIQMDSCRVAPGIIRFTAVDDCPGNHPRN